MATPPEREEFPYPCVGCGAPNAPECLWLAAPLGMCAVWVCRDRACAESARQKRGGGKFVPRPITKEERAMAKVKLKSAAAPPEESDPVRPM